MKVKFLVLGLIFSLSGCATMGGREISDDEINAEAAKAYVDIKNKAQSENKLANNKAWNDMVQRVSKRIAAASGENFQWEAILIDNPEPNAWCMPGGKIAVYTGIMPILKTEAALAAVLGHEVAHATRRHGKKGYSRAVTNNAMAAIAGVAAVGAGQLLCKTDTCKVLTAAGGVAVGFSIAFFDRKFSRADETEADKFGQIYMAKAGYDPAESIKLWERMNAANGGKAPPEWMSTHPSDSTRRENLTKWLPEAEAAYKQSGHHYGIGQPIN